MPDTKERAQSNANDDGDDEMHRIKKNLCFSVKCTFRMRAYKNWCSCIISAIQSLKLQQQQKINKTPTVSFPFFELTLSSISWFRSVYSFPPPPKLLLFLRYALHIWNSLFQSFLFPVKKKTEIHSVYCS